MTLREKIEGVVVRKEWSELPSVLDRLTNSEFRRVQPIVREELLPRLTNDDFWEAYRHFLSYRPQAFLPCIHCIGKLAANGTLNLNTADVNAISARLTQEQKQKLASMALPYLNDEATATQLLDILSLNDTDTRIALLIRQHTPIGYYLLFKTLKHMPDHHEKCLACCRFIMRRDDDLAYNMASILRSYFALHEIQGHLSLNIEPYELSYLESSFHNFCFILQGRRPSL